MIFQTLHTIHKASPLNLPHIARTSQAPCTLQRHHVGHPVRKATLGFNPCDIPNVAHHTQSITLHCQDVTSSMHSIQRHHVGHPVRKATLGFNLCDILNVANHTQSKLYPFGGHYSRHPERDTTLGFKQLSNCCKSYTKQHHAFHLQDVKRTMPSMDTMLDIL